MARQAERGQGPDLGQDGELFAAQPTALRQVVQAGEGALTAFPFDALPCLLAQAFDVAQPQTGGGPSRAPSGQWAVSSGQFSGQ